MADVAVEKETPQVASPEKKESCEKKTVEEVEEKAENGDGEGKENGASEKKVENDEDDEKEADKNGDSEKDVCCIKRKSTGGDATDGAKAEGVTPEKKPKLDEKVAEAESNGEAEATA